MSKNDQKPTRIVCSLKNSFDNTFWKIERIFFLIKFSINCALQTFVLSFVCSSYNVTFSHVISTIDVILEESDYYKSTKEWVSSSLDATWHEVAIPSRKAEHIQVVIKKLSVTDMFIPANQPRSRRRCRREACVHERTTALLRRNQGLKVSIYLENFWNILFRPIYLAILGRVYNVDGKKEYYGPGKSYHHFAGRDGTRAFTTGDFTENGLVASTHGLSHDELLCEFQRK